MADLPVEQLEEFGLERFIITYRLILCRRTVNQTQIAGFLHFDADQISIIDAPPDKYSRNQKLYELIETTTTARDFLEALEDTGNEHLIKFIRSTLNEPSTSSRIPPSSSSINHKMGLWFNIPERIDSFCGREDFLTQLHEKLQQQHDSRSTSEVTVLSQVKIISGLGGIGKTQTARRYIMNHRQFYNNFIWINAESKNSITNSVLKLADELKIPIKNIQGNSREIQQVVKDIYKKICEGEKSNLIVFDNAEDYESCKNFLPFGLHPDLKRPVILATSRNQEWISPAGNEVQVLPLDVLTYDESLEFILKQLEFTDSPNLRNKSKEFIELIGGLPLALQQAVAYIQHQRKVHELLGRSYQFNNYVQEFKSNMKKLQNFPLSPTASITVLVTWNMTLKKIKKEPKGKLAIKMIQVMSFLYADKIPVHFLLQLLPRSQSWVDRMWSWSQKQDQAEDVESKSKSLELAAVLELLQKFSMIKITTTFVSIHRQVQFVVVQSLKNSRKLNPVFNSILEKCSVVLKKIEASPKTSNFDDVFLSVHQIVRNPFNLIPVPASEKLVDFMHEFALVLDSTGHYSESLELHQQVSTRYKELKGDKDKKTIGSQLQVVKLLGLLGKYKEGSVLIQNLQKMDPFQSGAGFSCLTNLNQKSANLSQLAGKIEGDFQVLEEASSQIQLYASSEVDLETILQWLISPPEDKKELLLAKAISKYVDKNCFKLFGPNPNPELLLFVRHGRAAILYKLGKVIEAAKIFKEVYETRKELLGENHRETSETLSWLKKAEEEEIKMKKALDIKRKEFERMKRRLGENHPDTVEAKRELAEALLEFQEYDQALTLFQEIHLQQVETCGHNHMETLNARFDIGNVYYHQGEFEKALDLLTDLENRQTKAFGPHHIFTVATKTLKSNVLSLLGRSEET